MREGGQAENSKRKNSGEEGGQRHKPCYHKESGDWEQPGRAQCRRRGEKCQEASVGTLKCIMCSCE